MRLHRVKMMIYNEISKKMKRTKNDVYFVVPMGQEMLNLKFHGVSGLKVINYHFRRDTSLTAGNSESGRKTDTKNST